MYRSGDLARYLPDGTIEFVGRNDQQIKIRGFRVELGEIEACLVRNAEVREAVVVSRETAPQDARLVAYVVPETVGTDDLGKRLYTYLSDALPDYMVPAAFVELAEFPLTPSGKVDRMALPAPDGKSHLYQAYEPPLGDMEEILSSVWMEILGVDRVGRNDNFFQLGGNSLVALNMVNRLRRAGVHLNIRTLFTAPSLMALALEANRIV